MTKDRSPRIRRNECRHQKIEHSQKVDIYRPNTVELLAVRREDVSDDGHSSKSVRGATRSPPKNVGVGKAAHFYDWSSE